MLTTGLGLLTINVIGSINQSCESRYDELLQLSNNQTDVLNKIKDCQTEGFPVWYYLVFITSFGVTLALGIKKLAFI